jgi:BirA family biotin operon repressor/biotin-[acetyl-CoA-carboxylase] ligase
LSQLVRNTHLNPILIELQTIDSTNNYALQLIHAGLAQSGTGIYTHEQTAGKGQRNKTWHSSSGVNILLSTVFAPKALPVLHQVRINQAVAIAVHQFFSQYAGDGVRIKWPNDLYWQDRKAGGILIENIVGRDQNLAGIDTPVVKWSVIGTGININQTVFDPAATRPVSLKQITGRTFILKEMVRELTGLIVTHCERIHILPNTELLQEYNHILYKYNQTAWFKRNNQPFNALVKGVNEYGQLIIHHHGTDELIQHGDLEWIIP